MCACLNGCLIPFQDIIFVLQVIQSRLTLTGQNDISLVQGEGSAFAAETEYNQPGRLEASATLQHLLVKDMLAEHGQLLFSTSTDDGVQF